jgi:hypothetical protein
LFTPRSGLKQWSCLRSYLDENAGLTGKLPDAWSSLTNLTKLWVAHAVYACGGLGLGYKLLLQCHP